jgi:hypothetical protein
LRAAGSGALHFRQVQVLICPLIRVPLLVLIGPRLLPCRAILSQRLDEAEGLDLLADDRVHRPQPAHLLREGAHAANFDKERKLRVPLQRARIPLCLIVHQRGDEAAEDDIQLAAAQVVKEEVECKDRARLQCIALRLHHVLVGCAALDGERVDDRYADQRVRPGAEEGVQIDRQEFALLLRQLRVVVALHLE